MDERAYLALGLRYPAPATVATHFRRDLILNRTQKLLAACAVALAAPALIAGCGGDDGGDEDPADLLRTALSQDTEYESGVINIGLDGSLEGVSSGSINADISGPFQSGAEGQPTELDLSATADLTAEGIPQVPGGSFSFDFAGGLALADDSLFVTYQDTTFEASPQLYGQISPLLETAESASQTTQDPESADAFVNSLTNLENEGTEDIEGESVTHVSGDLDFAALAEQGAEQGVPLDTAQLEGLSSTIDVYVAEEDDTFRRLDLGFSADGVEQLSTAGIDGLDFTFSVGISDPNSEQTIEAPTDTQPLDELLQQFGTSEADLSRQLQQGLQGLTVPGAGRGFDIQPAPGGDLGEPGGAAADPQVQECIANAQSSDEIVECLNQ